MKLISGLGAAVVAALVATEAPSQPSGDFVILPGRGRGFVVLWVVTPQISYTVTDPTGDDIHSNTPQSARFRILANVPYSLDITFPTWQPDPPAPPDYRQPAFSNGDNRIGGRIYLDPTPNDPGNGDTIFQTPEGVLRTDGRRGMTRWGLGADISARFNDSPAGLAAPGVYSLDAEITIQPW
jgi:hypothetical protein